MNKKVTTYSIIFILCAACLLSIFSSCKKEELDRKEITYELTGDFGKTILVKYTPTDGTLADTEETVSLPWKKAVIPNAINASVGLVVTGVGGKPNANITAKIFVNGIEGTATTVTADANGNFVIQINHLF